MFEENSSGAQTYGDIGQQNDNYSPPEQKNGATESFVSDDNGGTNANTSTNVKNRSEGQQMPNLPSQRIVASARNEEDSIGYVLVENSDGKRSLKAIPKNSDKHIENDGNNNKQGYGQDNMTDHIPGATIEAEPVAYDLNEFSEAIARGDVDARRVPKEYQQQYADYKIKQAINDYNARQEAEKETAGQIDAQLNAEQQQEQMQKFLTSLDAEAEKRAAQDIGLSEEDVENLPFLDDDDPKVINYKLAKEWRRQELMQGLQHRYAEENAARQKQAAIYQDIRNFIDQAKSNEPNFDSIDKMMQTRYTTLSYAEGQQIAPVLQALANGTITESQTELLRKYYEDTRKEYYARKNGLSTTPKAVRRPPVVEQAGSGNRLNRAYTPDYSALGKADVRGRRAWLAEFIRNKNQ